MGKEKSDNGVKGQVGRPPGTLQTAQSVLVREIIESTKLMRDMRELVKGEVDNIGEALKNDALGMDKRLDVIGKLVEMMQSVGKAVGEAGKCLVVAKGEERGDGGGVGDMEAWIRKELGGDR